MKSNIITILLVSILVCFRIFFGIQINFNHEDYEQIYLIGLEYAFNDTWSYWGPDVVWSETRLPGGMQGFLAGFPLQVYNHPYSPIFFSNLLSAIGLILLALYGKKRFPSLNLNFLLALFLLLPFYLYHGTVLLNTAYLIFTGALLFIPVFELFIYRDKLIFKQVGIYFALMSFSLFITYQIHLTWVVYIPFFIVLLFLEIKNKTPQLWTVPIYIILGALISGSFLIPTIIDYGSVIYLNNEDNLNFDPKSFLRIFELFGRYFSFATYDVIITYNFYEVATYKSYFSLISLWAIKIFSFFQFALIWIGFYKMKKTIDFKRTLILFGLTLLTAIVLFSISNKHLESRTYLILFPVPLWLSLYGYEYWFKTDWIKKLTYGITALSFLAFLSVSVANYKGEFSFNSKKTEIEKALKERNPEAFGERRKSLMDEFN